MPAFVIHPDGRRETPWPAGHSPTLKEAQTAVGGCVQVVYGRVPKGETGEGLRCQLICHDEGKIIGLGANPPATHFARNARAIDPADYIAGPLVVLHGPEKWR